MIKIEFDKPKLEACQPCESNITRLTRFVYQDGNAFAIYYALLTDNDKSKVAHLLIGLGGWDEYESPDMRIAFAINIWDNNDNWAITVTDKDESPWNHVEFLGKIINREEALQHPRIKDIYHIADHIVAEDKSIIEFFE